MPKFLKLGILPLVSYFKIRIRLSVRVKGFRNSSQQDLSGKMNIAVIKP